VRGSPPSEINIGLRRSAWAILMVFKRLSALQEDGHMRFNSLREFHELLLKINNNDS
jgi:hypothetical protein